MSPQRTKLYMELVGVVIICATAIIYFSVHQTTLLTLVHGFPPLTSGQVWQQQFDDEFDASSLNPSYWTTCYDWYSRYYNGCSNTANGDLEWYKPGQVSVGKSYVQLSAIPFPASGLGSNGKDKTYPYRSGMISTGRTGGSSKSPLESFQYGFFEARLRVSSGKGISPQFQLRPVGNTWPPDIDIFTIYGDEPQDVMMGYQYGSSKLPVQDQSVFTGLSYYNDWHTYAVNWEPGHIDWYVDGILRKTVTGKNVPNTPMEMVLNLAVGGKGPGSPDARTPFPAQMDIDYVRVYKPILKGS